MATFVTVVAILALIAFGTLLIRLLNAQHSDRATAFHYGRSGIPAPGPAPSAPRKAHGRAAAIAPAGDRDRHDDGPRPGRPPSPR
ncbi:hypothetical protein [Streptomyces sp. NPDC029554]|uniref:hypothetical protein n=1 Tax=unclassified Streptomyces TaxID=2593676 RepID=UPI003411B635